MLQGLMMDRPLMISGILGFAAQIHGPLEIVSRAEDGKIHRQTYAETAHRVAKLAHALVGMGIKPGDRVATLAWNSHRHFELYYAIAGIGAVCHTINPRLFPEQIAYIATHADDVAIFFDSSFASVVAELVKAAPRSIQSVELCAGEGENAVKEASVSNYETLIADFPERFDWPDFDENTASSLCYTSGTTGDPKGVLYSHRSNVLHSLFCINSGFGGLTYGKKICPAVPLFHVNAWGLPFSAPMVGAELVFPGPRLDGSNLFDLLDRERVSSCWGVPTVWIGLAAEMRKRGRAPQGLECALIGGAPATLALIDDLEADFGISVQHAWGMTEMSPVGSVGILSREKASLPDDERRAIKLQQGRRMYGVDLAIVDPEGNPLPEDGKTSGELSVRGPTVIRDYFGRGPSAPATLDERGWFRTGDVARIWPDGYLQIVDRVKDLIKSGGEWISSAELEGIANTHPAIALSAVIGIDHPKWGERPILIVVLRSGTEITEDNICDWMSSRVARWQIPDKVLIVKSLPMTATGKISKQTLRQMVSAGELKM